MYGRAHPSFLRSQKKWQPLLPLLMDYVLLDFDPEVEDNYAGSVSGAGWSRQAVVVPIEARLRLLAVGILYEVCRVQKFSIFDLSESCDYSSGERCSFIIPFRDFHELFHRALVRAC